MDVEEGTVEAPPVLVLEDPKSSDLAGEPLRSGARVCSRDAEQHDDAAGDRPDLIAADRDRRLGDALDDGPHGYSSVSPSAARGRSERASLMCGVASLRRP